MKRKMSLQSLIISAFTISIAIFEKVACQQSASILQATLVFMKFRTENRGKPAFKLCDVLESPNEIDDQIKE